MLPHQLLEKVGDIVAGYVELKRQFPSPRNLISSLRKTERFISEVEKRYGSIDRFLDEFKNVQMRLDVIWKSREKD